MVFIQRLLTKAQIDYGQSRDTDLLRGKQPGAGTSKSQHISEGHRGDPRPLIHPPPSWAPQQGDTPPRDMATLH